MKKKKSILSSKYQIVWLVFTVHYIILFSIISSDYFTFLSVRISNTSLLPLNIVMNSTSLVLAVVGVLSSSRAAKRKNAFWKAFNAIIHVAMILWIFGGSIWVLLMMT